MPGFGDPGLRSNHRADRIEEMRHDHGSVLPPEVLRKMHSKEVDYFKAYDRLLASYMGAIDMDLTSVCPTTVAPSVAYLPFSHFLF